MPLGGVVGCCDYVITRRERGRAEGCSNDMQMDIPTHIHTHTEIHYQHHKRLRFRFHLRMASQTEMNDNRNCRKLRRCWRLGYDRTRERDRRDKRANRQGAIKSGAEIS